MEHQTPMKRFSSIIPKPFILPFFVLSFCLLVYLTAKVTRSNSAEVSYTYEEEAVVGRRREMLALHKLNKLVQKNFLDRDYYEASSFSESTWYRCYANYNKKYQALLIGDSDGWYYRFYATPAALKLIADREIPPEKFHLFLKPFPSRLLSEIPTRSRNLFSFF
jgi:hypothetical protein